MTLFHPWANNDDEAVYVMGLVFASAMAVSIVLAVDAIRRRNFSRMGRG